MSVIDDQPAIVISAHAARAATLLVQRCDLFELMSDDAQIIVQRAIDAALSEFMEQSLKQFALINAGLREIERKQQEVKQ